MKIIRTNTFTKSWHFDLRRLSLWLLVAVLVGSLFPQSSSVNAQAVCDKEFYSNNNILFYDPCLQNTVCSINPGVTNPGTISSVRGSNNGEKIYNFWIDAGMTIQQSAGITGSMQHEGGFSPFRQEESKTWPNGGWGIAQFTGGQRDNATKYVKEAIGNTLFTEYYKNSFGGAVKQSEGFIPSGVPVDVNDKFLLGELNYLLEHIRELQPNKIRRDGYKNDFNLVIAEGEKLYNHLKTLTDAGDAAVAWTYLYEQPANIKETSLARKETAKNILDMYSSGTGETRGCGGNLSAGGMTLEQAKEFMEVYKTSDDSINYIGTADQGCEGGPLSNCVSFSMYFINKYTSIDGTKQAGNGSIVAANLLSNNSGLDLKSGNSPRPYALFSTPSGSQMCGNVKCGHTGIILGVDIERKKVIVGEASCSEPASWDSAYEYDLDRFDSKNYTYVYTDGFINEEMMGGLQ